MAWPSVLGEALAAFLAVLDRYSLADLLSRRADMLALFRQDPPSPGQTAASSTRPLHAMDGPVRTADGQGVAGQVACEVELHERTRGTG
ncbi:helix-turn-helix domain-containing protein [Geminicoccus flavidas]|uniref:hypothetical protein n=1 Tax=Geminicoccus flavidas TaxID=2506407 RepID=UPI00190F2352|nr:hypothetical protein [Geminicoccus flavidas]